MGSNGKKRVAVPPHIEELVVTNSKRRCCLCWGLEHKNSLVMQGQIAHLDDDPANNDPGNLAWLCLAHHDAYDTRTSQSKGLTMREVKHHRDKLYAALANGAPLREEAPGVSPVVHAGGDINVGRDMNVTNVTQHITKTKRGKKNPPPILPGTVAVEPQKRNYLMYLIRRYNKFKKWDCDKNGKRFSFGVVHQRYQDDMKCEVCHTPLDRFDEAAAYLQGKIRNTIIGRIKAKQGNRLFDTFAEYPSGRDEGENLP